MRKGDIIFIHSNIAFFGKINSSRNVCKIFLETLIQIIGKNGTLIVPTFSYSIKNKFDLKKTTSVCGVFSEYLRKSKKGLRSADPIFSVYCIGKHSKYFTKIKDLNNYECFGEESFFEKFYKLNGKIVNFNDTCASTHVHYFEKLLGVGYRSDKLFKIKIVERNLTKIKNIKFFCIKNFKKIEARFDRFHQYALEKKLAKQIRLGLGIVTYMEIEKMKKIVFEKAKEKYFLFRKF